MEQASFYRDTIKKAIQITKSYKHLWILGFFAALLGNGGELEFILSQFNKLSSGTMRISQGIIASFGTGGSNVIKLIGNLIVLAHNNLGLIIVFGAVLFLFVWLAVSSQGALIRAVAVAGGMGQSNLREHFFKGSSSFFPLLGILLATRIGAFFVVAVIGIPIASLLIYFIDPQLAGVLVLFTLGIPSLIIASLISKYAICFHMLERKTWGQSILSAFKLFADNWLVSIELAVILFVINILMGAGIILLILVLSVPFILAGVMFQSNYQDIAITTLWVGQIIAFILLLLFGSILACFQYACWTELYLKIRKHKHLSKIVRTVMRVHERFR